MTELISEYEAERWRQLSDELEGQAQRLQRLLNRQGGSKLDWQAVEAIQSAARALFGAFGGVIHEAKGKKT